MKWNTWREETPYYDTSAKIDEVDWDAVVVDGESFHENLHHLKTQLSWRFFENMITPMHYSNPSMKRLRSGWKFKRKEQGNNTKNL